MRRRTLLASVIAAPLAAPTVVRAQDGRAQETAVTLRDLARRATIYLFPVYEMYRTRWQATVNEANPLRQRLNRFRHIAQLADHRTRTVMTPNNDAFYSSAWLDLAIEPMFLTVPPVGDLYYSYAFIDLFTNNFAYVSHRLHGGAPPTHMIVGPAWVGDPSSEVKLVRAPTNSVWLLGRLLVDGPEEVDRVRILQARALLETPDMRNERRILETRELMRQRTVVPAEPVADWAAPNPADPFDLFETTMRALGESPLAERDLAVFEGFAPLRLRPGRKFDLRAFSEAERRAILAGIEQGRVEIRGADRSLRSLRRVGEVDAGPRRSRSLPTAFGPGTRAVWAVAGSVCSSHEAWRSAGRCPPACPQPAWSRRGRRSVARRSLRPHRKR